jgi:hypothetical protein
MKGFTLFHVFMQLVLCNYTKFSQNLKKKTTEKTDFGGSKYV